MRQLIIAGGALLACSVAGCTDEQKAPAVSNVTDVEEPQPPEAPPVQEIEERAVPNKAQSQSGLRVQLQQTREKTSTAKSFSEVAASGLSKAQDVALESGQIAQPYLPDASPVLSTSVGN